MSLRSKLSRLTMPAAAAAPVVAPLVESASELDGLRARMQRILEKSVRDAPSKVAGSDREELPFSPIETPLGPLHLRRVICGPEQRIGHAPVHAARGADALLLSRLALDASLASCAPARALYLDTETTGLSGGTGTVAFLVGLAFFSEEQLVVEQLLVKKLGEEGPMLAHVLKRMGDASMLVTFNGKAFDLPLLRTRLVMARLGKPPELPHLDLLHVARRLHKARGVDCRLQGLEREVLGFERIDDTPGSEVAACYLHYLRTGETARLLGVVEHNLWDVATMAALTGLYGEPLAASRLHADDLAGASLTLKRGKVMGAAREAAQLALDRGGGAVSIRAGAAIAKAMGEGDRAIGLFERLVGEADCTRSRLELAKLYEHHAKDAERALSLLDAPLPEPEADTRKRRARLERKVAKMTQSRLF